MRIQIACIALAGLSTVLGAEPNNDIERLHKTGVVFQEIMSMSDKSIPQDLLDRSECIVIIPGLKKAAFVFGAKYGRGYASCRKEGGGWTGPGAVRVEGGSFGLQIGGAETDVVMLVMNKRGADRLLSSKFTLGGDASVAAGPVGRDAQAQTDAFMTAEILSWSRSRGVFGGLSLSGATMRQDLDVNQALYGQPYENKQILHGEVPAPGSTKEFLGLLTKYSGRKS